MARDGLAVAYSMKKRAKMAKGGVAEPHHPGPTSIIPEYQAARQHEEEEHLKSPKGEEERKKRNAQMLAGMKAQKMAHGGMVDRIMAKRKCYAEGGVVANDVGEGDEADELPNQFDDMELDDHLEGHEHADGPGSDLNQEKGDMIDRIMRKRRG